MKKLFSTVVLAAVAVLVLAAAAVSGVTTADAQTTTSYLVAVSTGARPGDACLNAWNAGWVQGDDEEQVVDMNIDGQVLAVCRGYPWSYFVVYKMPSGKPLTWAEYAALPAASK